MKIRPQWVLALVILVVMFIAARVYVGRAIESATRSEVTERKVQAPRERPPPRKPKKLDATAEARVAVIGPANTISSVVEVSEGPEREAVYERVRERLSAVDEATAALVAVGARKEVLRIYRNAEQMQEAAPVATELAAKRQQLESWWK